MPCGDKCCQRIHFFEKKRFSVLNVRTLITQKARGRFPQRERPRAHRVQKSNYAAVEALALSLVLLITVVVLGFKLKSARSDLAAAQTKIEQLRGGQLAGSDTDVLDGAVEAGALEEEESVPQATRDSAISAATARTRTFFIVKTSIFSILYTASLPAPQSAAQGHL